MENTTIYIGGQHIPSTPDAKRVIDRYRNSIKQYFLRYDDSAEITMDIEYRIAELLYHRAKLNNGPVNLDDAESVISKIGYLEDFEFDADEYEKEEPKTSNEDDTPNNRKRNILHNLYRDPKRRYITGLCAGIAHKTSIDASIIRIITLILFSFFPLSILIYLGLSKMAEDREIEHTDKNIRKLYRDEEDVWIGGVASGLAKYFDKDVKTIRFIFLISLFFGGGFVYVAIWAIVPTASSIADRMEMNGQQFNIHNVSEYIGDRFVGTNNSPIGTVLKVFRKLFGYIFGFYLLIISFTIFAISIGLGLFRAGVFNDFFAGGNIVSPVLAMQGIPVWGVGFLVAMLFFSAILFTALAFIVISGKPILSRKSGSLILLLWFASISGTFMNGFKFGKQHKQDIYVTEKVALAATTDSIHIDISPADEAIYLPVHTLFKVSPTDSLYMEINTFSLGETREDAIANADRANVPHQFDGQTLTLSSMFYVDGKYDFQYKEVIVYIPKEMHFSFGANLEIENNFYDNYEFQRYYNKPQANTYWLYGEDGVLMQANEGLIDTHEVEHADTLQVIEEE